MKKTKDILWGGATASSQYEGGYKEGGKGLDTQDCRPYLKRTSDATTSTRLLTQDIIDEAKKCEGIGHYPFRQGKTAHICDVVRDCYLRWKHDDSLLEIYYHCEEHCTHNGLLALDSNLWGEGTERYNNILRLFLLGQRATYTAVTYGNTVYNSEMVSF